LSQTFLEKLRNNIRLTEEESKKFISSVFDGEVTSDFLTEVLLLLNKNGFGSQELTGFARSMRDVSRKVISEHNVVDNCGTGGDGIGTFNISTTASLIAASAGAYVAKHGNKAITSNSGSADVLEAAGVNITLTPDQVSTCIDQINFGFMFAPLHHEAMRHVATSRKSIAPDKTIFNLLGPLTNPAGSNIQLIGVYSKDIMQIVAETVINLGIKRAMIVHSYDGLDEISIFEKTHVLEIIGPSIKQYNINPNDYFENKDKINDIIVSSAKDSLELMNLVFDNIDGPMTKISLINAAALVYLSGIEDNMGDALKCCKEVLASKKVKQRFSDLIELTKNFE